ncbi:hypothetical protein [Pseudomonas umsongensis]|jgi:hypothetical protein|uniref:hypothetical protein n=1 Tax=Pseudomonas umsongensis TaxID=198618 RepID=UPI0015BE93E6|nr:hypothetical protein [Pseudomonas umsongensis]NWL18298.1 hypothetical protein [Pseudomonas umsongensis]
MSNNSLESLLEQMSAGSICRGWGAIAAVGRSQLNRLLEEQYLARLGEYRTVAPLSGEVLAGDNDHLSVTLDSIVLGKPVLSFEKASLNSSLINLSMDIVGGTYTSMSLPVTAAPTLMTHFSIRQEHGYKVEMQLKLDELLGEVDRMSRVTLDLASGENLTTNLGDMPGVQAVIAPLIKTHLARQGKDRRLFELSLLDLSGTHGFTPAGVYFRTQRAPGAGDPSAANYGDGCLLLFIRLKIRDEADLFPGEGSGFPYLIPDDPEQGKAKFTASMVLNGQWADLVNLDDRLDIPSSLRFSANNTFKQSGEFYRPHDLLVLGNVVPTEDHLRIEPGFVSLDGTKPVNFTARDHNGNTVNVAWSVSNPVHPQVVGEITSSGRYTPLEKSKMYQAQVPLVVTARYTKGDREYVNSSSVLSVYEGMGCSPHIYVTGVGQAQPIALTVATTGNEVLEWPKLDPADGAIRVVDNNHALYTPPTTQAESLALRKIKIQGEEATAEATVVTVSRVQTLAVTPPFVSIGHSAPVQLTVEGFSPQLRQWSVIGEGTVTGDGLFTPPEGVTSLVSVVKCDIVFENEVIRSGFSIIHLQERQQPSAPEYPEETDEPRWDKLAHFTITTLGEPKNDSCYHNGFQQIPVLITIETHPITYNGETLDIPVSDLELSTLQLVNSEGNIIVKPVEVGQEGIEYGSETKWAVSKTKNRFREYSAMPLATSAAPEMAAPDLITPSDRTRTVRFYIHLAEAGSRTFFARFQSHRGFHNSIDTAEVGREVTVQGVRIPVLVREHYHFERQRVWADDGGYDDAEPGNPYYPLPDVFTFYRQTVDYWNVYYKRAGQYAIGFATLSFESNTTILQWESELLEEEFGSYTGHAFNPARYAHGDTPAPKRLEFDGGFMLFREETKAWAPSSLKQEVSPGQLIISLHRTDDMNYWYDDMANGNKYKFYRRMMDDPLRITLMDEEGNRHKLKIEFKNKSLPRSRNELILTPL